MDVGFREDIGSNGVVVTDFEGNRVLEYSSYYGAQAKWSHSAESYALWDGLKLAKIMKYNINFINMDNEKYCGFNQRQS